ncbi:MAG: Holliday junction resolvase RuvX [Clostridia bacterium]|nr:Holliday junction resolvase RuvX [Clostridia bacterium]
MMLKERIVALDVGDRRIGIAVSDPLGLTAQPIETYTRVGYGPDTRHIKAVADSYNTSHILCGLPRNMDGSEGFQVGKVREFAAQLEQAGLTVEYYDERMTTIQAESALLEGGLHRDERKRKVDMVAAVMILQSYLDAEASRQRAEAEMADADAEEPDDEEDSDIWVFDDEDGNPVTLRLVHEVTIEGIRYLLFNDMDNPDPDADFLVMAESDVDGELQYESVEDEELIQHIYDIYLKNSDQ